MLCTNESKSLQDVKLVKIKRKKKDNFLMYKKSRLRPEATAVKIKKKKKKKNRINLSSTSLSPAAFFFLVARLLLLLFYAILFKSSRSVKQKASNCLSN